jgi:hypothetical protein
MLRTIQGNIIDAQERVLCHQTNCRTSDGVAMGVAKVIFDRYPDANIYTSPRPARDPGYNNCSMVISEKKIIVNMNAQRYPGPPRHENDTAEKREHWFGLCMADLGDWCKSNGITSVAMPYLIGCGLGQGSWLRYEAIIRLFCETYRVNVTLYRL